MIGGMRDTFQSRQAAQTIALEIEDYWRRIAYNGIKTSVHAESSGKRGTIYSVRSNIGPLGYPPK